MINEPSDLSPALVAPTGFSIHEVTEGGTEPQVRGLLEAAVAQQPPPLGPLEHFVGNWTGHGFNTIFRPESAKSPTSLPNAPTGPSDNVLEINLTQESLSFSKSLGSIPNRGSDTQADAFLNGVPYLQTISDVTTSQSVGIHFEPGLWLSVPKTTAPQEGATLARLASIPHGTSITAQGIFSQAPNKPDIPPVDITPTNPTTGTPLSGTFPSQTASDPNTRRIPQNLAPFIAAGTITQEMLDDPNSVLRQQLLGQTVTETITISISTDPTDPLFGGGAANIAFLQGVPVPPPTAIGPNAQTSLVKATFWIETVVFDFDVPAIPANSEPLEISPRETNPRTPLVPRFVVKLPPGQATLAKSISVSTTQIQYSQEVILNFAGLKWPHVSVATLVKAEPIPISIGLLL